ncbi:unnamed protein product [Rotaria socialis]|uniref:Uncharacterized protein n=1 Tax=Rotaria socialis TaxID=392032 RepID=A0A817TBZ0_9BILA|nr:unnamed protein product [Rotaria socialis]CAF4519445.1 unnamed protein product [Rotaria socialis]
MGRGSASWIGRLSSKRAAACVEENTDIVRTVVCDNNVWFVVAIDIGCYHNVWMNASWIGRLSNKRAVTYVEENTDIVRTVVCDNNVGFAVSIDIGYWRLGWLRAS